MLHYSSGFEPAFSPRHEKIGFRIGAPARMGMTHSCTDQTTTTLT